MFAFYFWYWERQVAPFRDESFSGAVCFTMLHHVPPAELQDRLLREECRVICTGAVFAGVDRSRTGRCSCWEYVSSG